MNRKRMTMKNTLALAAALLAVPAFAHVTVSPAEAEAGRYVKLVFTVPHGCAGSPTTGIGVTLPPGVIAAKPMPKPEWRLTIESARLDPPVTLHGRKVDSTAAQITWDGGSLPGDLFDEFAIHARLPEEPGELRFVVQQTCEQGRATWNGAADSATPAPVLKVLPAGAASGHAHH